MCRRLWLDIVDADAVLVLIDNIGGNIAVHNLGKNRRFSHLHQAFEPEYVGCNLRMAEPPQQKVR